MNIDHNKIDDVTIIALAGRFDSSTVKDFKATVNSLIENSPVKFVFDMGAVTYVDSSALGSLVSFLRSVREDNGDIRIASLTDKIRSVFNLTRLHKVFEIYDDPNAAVKSFSSK